MRLQHPIFHAPLDPHIVLGTHATPENYRAWPGGRDLPDELPTWEVHQGAFPASVDVGLVSDPYGFEDSPDAEWISSGINSKGPSSVALGRQGNLFLWGFAGDAAQMTESARRVFLNTICYMKQFDGRTPLVGKEQSAREWGQVFSGYVAEYTGEGKQEPDWIRSLFPAPVLERCGLDAAALESYYRENLPYLRPGENGMIADEDLLALQVSNRDVRLLELLVERFASDPADPLGRRLLERYVGADMKPEALNVWLQENRPYLFFSDVGGFRWFIDTRAKAEAQTRRAAVPAGSGR